MGNCQVLWPVNDGYNPLNGVWALGVKYAGIHSGDLVEDLLHAVNDTTWVLQQMAVSRLVNKCEWGMIKQMRMPNGMQVRSFHKFHLTHHVIICSVKR